MFEACGTNAAAARNTTELSAAIHEALGGAPRIQMLAADVGRRQADVRQAGMPESPDLQFGLGRARERDAGSSVRLTPPSTTTAEVSGTRQETDGSKLGVRLYPPNPWVMSAAVSAAEAARGMAEADLLREQHTMVCDIVESAVRIDSYARMLHVQTSFVERCAVLRKKAADAVRDGTLRAEDFADVQRIHVAAGVEARRLAARVTACRNEFAALTGVDAARVGLTGVTERTRSPLSVMEKDNGLEHVVGVLAQARPDCLVAYWNMRKCESEAREAGAALIPWFTHVGASYSWRDGSEDSWKTDDSGVSTSGREDSRGSEWWTETAIKIPMFEWCSGETEDRRALARSAQLNLGLVLGRVQEDIRLARQQLKDAQETLATARAQYAEEEPEMRRMAASVATQGLTGAANAVRIEQGSVQMLMFVLEQGMEVALAELHLCRVTGLIPGENGDLTGFVRSSPVDAVIRPYTGTTP
jgi:outer membrane protein TolC